MKILGIIITAVFILNGCSTLDLNPKANQTPSKYSTSSSSPASKSKPASAIYYDFGDILLPVELEVDNDATFVFKTPGYSAGVLSLTGNVELNSLITFFNSNMAKDNWKQSAQFKSPRSMMLYQKENRWCVINISRERFTTRVEIWVAPTVEGLSGSSSLPPLQSGTGLLK
ncbi:MAG: hypothetical protein HQK79_13430 [Desulfobacterales bacterium]|nr:hypothetical protein [Desulfobacterales bacterium]MBF0395985.1 hypothetical protein [Desulfobacterales bacterium]